VPNWFEQNAPPPTTAAPAASSGTWFDQNAPRSWQAASGSTFGEKMRNAASMLGDVGIGALKGVGSTIAGLGEQAVNAGLVPGQTPAAFNPAFRHPLFQKIDDLTTATNTPQQVGKIGEQVAEFALPTGKVGHAALEAIPSAERAAGTFQGVMQAAREVPVNTDAAGSIGLRIQELADRGGSMPQVVRKFLGRITDPEKAQMTYGEARDFASNISRLSANEFGRLTPVIGREVSGLRVALNKAIADAAEQAGKGQDYAQAMREYARAKQLENVYDSVLEGAKRGLPYATAAGVGSYLAMRLRRLLPGE
jgi:hypothetical protein